MPRTKTAKEPIPPPEVTPEPTLSKEEITRAVTNSPALAQDEFKLGDKTYKIVDLAYDDYLDFVALLKPIFDTVFNKKTDVALPGIELPSSEEALTKLLKYGKKELPELACIVCKQTDSEVTTTWLKKNASPIKLANVVVKQLLQNNMVGDFADFFVQALPLIKAMQQ